MCTSGGKIRFLIFGSIFYCVYVLNTGYTPALSSNHSLISICEIQGSDFISPHAGEKVKTNGVVHGDFDETWRKGFFIQDPECDGDTETSDGLYVYLGERIDWVNEGDAVEVSGTIQEYYGLTEVSTSPVSVTVKSTGNLLPTPVELSPPFNNTESKSYYESLEGMRVALDEAIAVGPTDFDHRAWVIRSDLGMKRVFQNDPKGTGEIMLVDDTGLDEIPSDLKVGDKIQGISGVMDYVFDGYRISLLSEPLVLTQSREPNHISENSSASNSIAFTAATYNLWNLFDTFDDPETDDDKLSSTEFQKRLKKRALTIHEELNEPDILAIQEVETQSVLLELTNQDEINSDYGVVWIESLDARGLDTSLIYRADKVQIINSKQHQGCTNLIDGLGPDGNHDVDNPANEVTCDLDGIEGNEGNRLFSRPPLLVEALICADKCDKNRAKIYGSNLDGIRVWFIVVHWKSKFEDTDTYQYTLLRRLEQSQFTAELVQEIISSDNEANVIVLGDFNDYTDSFPIKLLESNGLTDLINLAEREDRYTYIYRGVSQVLDHVMVRLDPELKPAVISPVHINSDFPHSYKSVPDSVHRSSDHDPVLVSFIYKNQESYLPIIFRKR